MSDRSSEFRVLGVAFGRPYVNENPATLAEAERYAERFRGEGDRNVHVEQREVGPWMRVAPAKPVEEK